jgi:hypothetical protein
MTNAEHACPPLESQFHACLHCLCALLLQLLQHSVGHDARVLPNKVRSSSSSIVPWRLAFSHKVVNTFQSFSTAGVMLHHSYLSEIINAAPMLHFKRTLALSLPPNSAVLFSIPYVLLSACSICNFGLGDYRCTRTPPSMLLP